MLMMKTFLKEPSYLGDAAWLHRYWRDALHDAGDTPPDMALLASGAIGVGRTSFVLLGGLYDVCCLLDHVPEASQATTAETFGTVVVVPAHADVAATKDYVLALAAGIPHLNARLIDAAPDRIDFGPSVSLHIRSVSEPLPPEAHFTSAVFVSMGDQGLPLFHELWVRRETLLREAVTALPGRIWLEQSAAGLSAELDRALSAWREGHALRLYRPALWDCENRHYSGTTFPVYVVRTGAHAGKPIICTSPDVVPPPAWPYLIHVPEEHRREFEHALPRALRDLAGIAPDRSLLCPYGVGLAGVADRATAE